jgi:hypothetical protein
MLPLRLEPKIQIILTGSTPPARQVDANGAVS